MSRRFTAWVAALAAAALTACAASPRELAYDADGYPGRPYEDGAFGPPVPGRYGGFGEEDWRYGRFTPVQVDPEPMLYNLDVAQQVNNSPASGIPLGPVDLFFLVSSEDDPYDDDPGADSDLGGVMPFVRIPF